MDFYGRGKVYLGADLLLSEEAWDKDLNRQVDSYLTM